MIVVKIGGGKGVDEESVCADLFSRKAVLVHGCSNDVNELSARFGIQPRFVTSASGHESRFTDAETIKVFEMACGVVNNRLVKKLREKGINAIGLSGASVLQAQRKESVRVIENGKEKILHGDFTGKVTQADERLLALLLENGFTPVVSPLASAEGGVIVNVDGDRAAARVACALKAETLVILSNVPGVLREAGDEASLIRELNAGGECACAKGRMKKKLLAAKEAIEGGVKKVVIADSRLKQPVAKALEGIGTMVS